MPEVVSSSQATLSTFAAGAGKGSIYVPLPQDTKDGVVRAHAIQTINSDPQTLYAMWRKIESAPRWQEYVVSVTEQSATRSHWVFGDPEDADGKRFEFDSEIVEDVPGSKIAWRSVTEGFDESGQVTFEASENGRGTRVTLQEHMPVPGGILGSALAALAKRSPRQIVIENLRHFKQIAEAGEIPSVVGQSNGPRGFSGSLKAHLYGENNPTPPGPNDF